MERRELEQLIKEHYRIRRIAATRQVSYTTIRYWLRRLKLRKVKGMSITRIRRNCPTHRRKITKVETKGVGNTSDANDTHKARVTESGF